MAAEDRLHDRAASAVGFDDFGNSSYRENLRAYLGALDEVGNATDEGRDILLSQVDGLLQARLHMQAALKAHPQVRDTRIKAPIFVLGLPRTGTTALHNILMCDPQFQGLQSWLAQQPMPRPARDQWESFPVFRQVQQGLDAMFAMVPEMKAMHWMAADEVDECRAVMSQTFANTSLSWPSDLEPYARWLYQHDMTPEYQYYANALKLIGSNDADKTWLLKCPHHSISADKLLQVFPDARLIFLHRDPVSVVPSIVSMVYRLRMSTEGSKTRPERCGQQMLNNMDFAMQRLRRVRAEHPENFVDLRFGDLMTDPIAAMSRLYDQFGMELSEATVVQMRGWLAANPQGKHGSHRYTPEDFGLSAAMIRERFHDYNDY
jgi:hypothetical protein